MMATRKLYVEYARDMNQQAISARRIGDHLEEKSRRDRRDHYMKKARQA